MSTKFNGLESYHKVKEWKPAGNINLIRSGEQEVATTVDKIIKHMWDKRWEINPTKKPPKNKCLLHCWYGAHLGIFGR